MSTRKPRKWLTLDSVLGSVDVYLIKGLTDETGTPVDGLFLPDKLIICIDGDLVPNRIRSTLLHEMLHLAFASGSKSKMLEDNEEEFVSFMETPLFDLLRRNKMLRLP
jgi:hypothetical protein